jgi:hypothetical protein
LTETNKETNGFAVKNVSINQFDWGRKSSWEQIIWFISVPDLDFSH